MNILFTGVGRRVELVQAFRNAALVLNKDLKIYGEDLSHTAPALAFCDYTRHMVGIKDPKYIDGLLGLCREDCIDLMIPTIDTNLLILSQNKERFEKIGTKVLISPREMIAICRDKNLTTGFFISCGLQAPKTMNRMEGFTGPYPCFIKPKDGSSSINAFKVGNEKELETYSEAIRDYIIQEYIDGDEYTVDIFCDFDGKPIYITPRRRLQVRAGEVLKTEIDLDGKIIEECEKIIERFKPCGPLTVQLIRDKEGVDWFIEINPRYGGGAPLSMKAGARSAEAVLKLLSGEEVEKGVITDGAIYSRFDQSVCVRETKGEIKGVIFDLDDTLYSEKDYVRSGYKAVAEYLGHEEYRDRLWAFFIEGKSAFDELLREIGREDELEKCIEVYRSHKPEIKFCEGAEELISTLKSRGLKVGIITDGRPEGQRNKLKALGIDRLDFIITDELGGIQFRKPCDIAFRIMAQKWKLPYNQIVYIGDNPAKDFQAPQQLGMRSMYFRNPEGLYSGKGNSGNSINSMGEIGRELQMFYSTV